MRVAILLSMQANRRKLANMGIVVALILAFQVVGPLLDHYVLERLPTHTHVYLGGLPRPHEHVGATLHTHDQSEAGEPGGIVFLPNRQSMLQLLSLPTLVLPVLLLALLTPPLLVLLGALYGSNRAQASPRPLVPPPRMLLSAG